MTACGKPVYYQNRYYRCSLPENRPGRCRTWVEEADTEAERIKPDEKSVREQLGGGWR